MKKYSSADAVRAVVENVKHGVMKTSSLGFFPYRFGDVYFRMNKNDELIAAGVVVSSGPAEMAEGVEVGGGQYRRTKLGGMLHKRVRVYRRRDTEGKEGGAARISIRDWAQMLVGSKFPFWRRVAIWLDAHIFRGRTVVRKWSRTIQTEDAMLISVAVFRRSSFIRTLEDAVAIFENNPEVWQKLDATEERSVL